MAYLPNGNLWYTFKPCYVRFKKASRNYLGFFEDCFFVYLVKNGSVHEL